VRGTGPAERGGRRRVKIAANASKEANRTEPGLRKLAAQVIAGARRAAADEDADKGVLPGTDLLLGADTAPGPDPRSRAGRALACLDELQEEREAAEAAAREQGRAYLEALAAGAIAAGRPPAAVALAAQQLRLEMAIAAEEAALADWQARRAAGQRAGRPPARPGTGKKARKARARLEALQAGAAAEAGQPADAGNEKKAAKAPQRNVTDPDSRLMPVRGGGFIQGYNCQDAASDDRLMLGGYACQDTGDVLQAQELARVAARGAAVVAAGHAAHAADPAVLAKCHDRMCTLPEEDRHDPGHDIAACHAAMTSRIGVLVQDAGYHSEANLTAPGPARLIADGKTSGLACREPAQGPPPADATPRRSQRTPAAHPRRPRRLQAPRPRRRGPARQPQRPGRPAPLQPPRPAQRHQRVPLRRPRRQPPAAGRHQLNMHAGPAARRGHSMPANNSKTSRQHQNGHHTPLPEHAPGPNPGTGARQRRPRCPPQENATGPMG